MRPEVDEDGFPLDERDGFSSTWDEDLPEEPRNALLVVYLDGLETLRLHAEIVADLSRVRLLIEQRIQRHIRAAATLSPHLEKCARLLGRNVPMGDGFPIALEWLDEDRERSQQG